MIDFHTHVLPRIDDGSKSMEMTLAMLKEDKRQGAEAVVATPHFYADRSRIDEFLDRRQRRLADVLAAVKEKGEDGFPKLYTGAEVYFFTGISRAERLPDLRIEGTDTILIEMPFCQWTDEMADEIAEIVRGRGMKTVLAHIERYIGYQKDRSQWERIMAMPLTTQMNAGSFIKDRKKRKFCLRWLAERPDSIIASDCHNLDTRRPNLAEARTVIEKKMGRAALDMIDANTRELLGAGSL